MSPRYDFFDSARKLASLRTKQQCGSEPCESRVKTTAPPPNTILADISVPFHIPPGTTNFSAKFIANGLNPGVISKLDEDRTLVTLTEVSTT